MNVHHNPQARRFELSLPAGRAQLDYQVSGGTVLITHTEVPPALRGQGLAERLARAALAWAEAQKLAVEPQCSYVAAFIEQHPEFRRLLPGSLPARQAR